MPTLEDRAEESIDELRTRLMERQGNFAINQEFSYYIEMMEKYLLAMERRVNRLETLNLI
jgi:hypothetical protein